MTHRRELTEQSETFQDDIYPDTLSGEPSLASDDWFGGKDAPLQLLSMESVYHHGAGGQPSHKRDFIPLNTTDVPQQSHSTQKAAQDEIPAPATVKRPILSEGDKGDPSTSATEPIHQETPKTTLPIVENQPPQKVHVAPVKVDSLFEICGG